ncbi:ribonuclease H-like domain-containing protein [Tanacetum coccineum]
MKLMQFLIGLNEVVQPIRSSLLSIENLPDVKDSFAIISIEESHRGIASSSSGNNRGPNPNLLCTNYRKVRHTIDRCFDIIGYPPGYNKNPGPKQNGSKTFNAKSASTSNEKGAILSFTNDHIMKLMNLINEVPSGSIQANMACWIIDSGANQHMTISTDNMFGIIDISDLNLVVGHPNGTLAKIKYVGNLILSKNVMLFDVLVVLEYCVSLMSVNKLIKDIRLFVGFTESKCYIQDLHLNKITRTGSENGGLYLFDSPSPISSNCQTIGNQIDTCYVSKSLWYNGLGHPFDQAVDVLQSKLNFTKDSHISPCDICHKAKQTREPFPLSYHKTTAIGKLVHVDIWGPYKVISRDGFRYFMTIVDDYTRAVWIYMIKTKDEVYVFNAQKLCLENTSSNASDVKLLHEYVLLAAKHVDTPLPENTTLNHIKSDNDHLLDNIGNYQRLVGKLIYLTNIGPNISYVVQCLSQFMHAPLVSHLDAALRVLRCLKGSPRSGIQINKNGNLKLRAYVDSNWVRCPATRKSISEAEYRSMASTTCEVIWLSNLLSDIGVKDLLSVVLYCDNSSAL